MILVAGMMLASSCGKTDEETAEETTEAETTIVETTVEETTAETSEETTAQTEETEEPEESEAVERPDAIEFDISEFPFEINESTFVQASENVGGTVLYGTDEFMGFVSGLRNGEAGAMEQYISGIGVVVSGDDVDSLIEQFGDPSAGMDSGFDERLTDMGIFTAADPLTQDYQIVVMYYKVDDSEYLAEWFDSASDNFKYGMYCFPLAFILSCLLLHIAHTPREVISTSSRPQSGQVPIVLFTFFIFLFSFLISICFNTSGLMY